MCLCVTVIWTGPVPEPHILVTSKDEWQEVPRVLLVYQSYSHNVMRLRFLNFPGTLHQGETEKKNRSVSFFQ